MTVLSAVAFVVQCHSARESRMRAVVKVVMLYRYELPHGRGAQGKSHRTAPCARCTDKTYELERDSHKRHVIPGNKNKAAFTSCPNVSKLNSASCAIGQSRVLNFQVKDLVQRPPPRNHGYKFTPGPTRILLAPGATLFLLHSRLLKVHHSLLEDGGPEFLCLRFTEKAQ